MGRDGERFDAIVLDPPAFVKSRKKLPEAIRGYLTVNRRAMELLEPGGFLLTCSCSHHIGAPDLDEAAAVGAAKAGRRLRLITRGGQAADHPVLPAAPETEYLHALFLEVR